MRARAWYLAAVLALAGCKSEDKPKQADPAPAPPPTPAEMKEKAAESAEQVKEKAETAADKAKAAIEAAKDRMQAAGEVAVDKAADALTDAKGLREALVLLEGRINKAIEDMKNAPSDDARQTAAAALEKLAQEKQKLQDRLAALAKDAKAKAP
jgi:colicin import membrane protein